MALQTNISKLLKQYREYGLEKAIDFDRFNRYALTHHSTRLEGSTLTEIETQVLLAEGKTPKGKPLAHSLMVQDHFNALSYVIEKSRAKEPISVSLIQEINALTMKHTGKVYNTVLGNIDASRGEFRKGNVSAGTRYFVNFEKVESMTTQLAEELQARLADEKDEMKVLETSFIAHFDLVSIHPFYDGNGRTSRLLMNYIQSMYDLPMAWVYDADKSSYIEALEESRNNKELDIFISFMNGQYSKQLRQEIEKYEMILKDNEGRGFSLVF
jgi:Fic family protein